MTEPSLPASHDLDHRALAALLLRSLAVALLWAAGAVAAMAWVGTWEGAPHFGIAAYLLLPMLVGAGVLLGLARRLPGTVGADRPQPTEGSVTR